jgi:hypothetical protein
LKTDFRRFSCPIESFFSAWRRLTLLFAVALPCALPSHAATLTRDTVWSGEVRVEEDLLVPAGVTLTIEAGTRVVFAEAQSTKTDPQFWNPDTEISVAGRLDVKGSAEAPVRLEPQGSVWGGLVAAPGGQIAIRHAKLSRASEAFLVYRGSVSAEEVSVVESECGVVLGPEAKFQASGVTLIKCQKGIVDLRADAAGMPSGVTVAESSDAPLLGVGWKPEHFTISSGKALPPPDREFLGEYTVNGEESWRGTIVISGRVTVPPESKLTLEPGTRVAFRKRDTNGDGLGEGELMVLGSIRSLGTAEAPVVFESAETQPAAGDWDKLSVISSEDPDNRFEHTVFRHGTQALHAHFSKLFAVDCVFEDNLRAVQFQESELVVVERGVFRGNKQALRFRDSTVRVKDCRIEGNLYAVHAFRAELEFTGNTVAGTLLGGMLVKESRIKIRDNRFLGNRMALRQKGGDASLDMTGNVVVDNAETALSLNEVEAKITGNDFDRAGLDLVGIEGGHVVMRANKFGVSGRDAVHLNGPADVDAKENTWVGDPKTRIHDGEDDPSLGKVLWSPVASELKIQN